MSSTTIHTRKAVCTALIAVQLGGCTSWRVQPVAPRDLPAFVAAHSSAPLRLTLGNGNQVVISQAHVSSDTLLGTVRGQPVHIAMADVGMVARRRTSVLRSVGLAYVIVLAAAGLACGASDCFSYSLSGWQ